MQMREGEGERERRTRVIDKKNGGVKECAHARVCVYVHRAGKEEGE